MTPGRLILSAPGYEASPALSDEFKIFDTEWVFTGRLIASGFVQDPSTPNSSGPDRTDNASPIVVPLPTIFDVQPSIVLRPVDPGSFVSLSNLKFIPLGFRPSVSQSQLIMTRTSTAPGGSGAPYRRHHFFFWVYSG